MSSHSRRPGPQDIPLPGMDPGGGLLYSGEHLQERASGLGNSQAAAGDAPSAADIARGAAHEAYERQFGLRPTQGLSLEQRALNAQGARAVIRALNSSGSTEPVAEKRRTTRRVSLATALRPDFIGINPADFSDITADLIALADPDKLQRSLIPPERKRYSASYVRGDTQRVEHVAMTPEVYGIIVSHVGSFAGRVSARTSVSRPAGNIHDAAAERSGLHAIQAKLEQLGRYRAEGIEPRRVLIERFREAARYPGLARFSSKDDFLAQLTYLQTAVIDDMITVIRHQRRWSNPDASERLLRRTITAAMFVERTKNAHIGYFRSMMDLAADYYGSQWALARDRERQASKYIKEHETSDG